MVDALLVLIIVVGVVYFLYRRSQRSGGQAEPQSVRSSYTGGTAAKRSHRPQGRSRPHFAVVDVETSSLSPKDGRIIEIGIVHLDQRGDVTHEWQTLLNPGDGVSGNTSIHGIEAKWLAVAPTFADVAGDIVERLRHRVLVAHNAKFDTGFLEAEFNRLANPLGTYEPLCTIEVARALGLPPKLSSAAAALGHRFNHHTAVEDAGAAGRIVAAALRAGMTGHEEAALDDRILPRGLTPSGRTTLRLQAAEAARPRPFLTEAMLRADIAVERHDADDDTYRDLLERALEDGVLDPDECRELIEVANQLGLTHARAMELHRDLVLSILDAALDDNRITAGERAEIEQAATWLNVDLSAWDELVAEARARRKQRKQDFRDYVRGKVVAFTGRGGHPKDVREGLALKYGMTAKTRVTADTDLLLIGSEDVDNKQTESARERDLPVLLEAAFWQRLGATTPENGRSESPGRPNPLTASENQQPVGFALVDKVLDGVTPGRFEGRAFHEWVDAVKQLRREGRIQDAERILIGCIQATEAEARRDNTGVAPAYYEQLAILYDKQKMPADEIAVLERYAAQPHAPGALPEKLARRLAKARAKGHGG